MGLFDRIYHEGHGEPAQPTADIGADSPRPSNVRDFPGTRRAPEKKGTSAFAWGVLGVFGLFGAGYLASALKGPPGSPKKNDDEEEE